MSIRVTIPTTSGNPGLADPKIGIQIRKLKKDLLKYQGIPSTDFRNKQ